MEHIFYQMSNRLKISALLVFLICQLGFGQGPNTPEAGAFEPIDAKDMVSLNTGDFTYVLPLMNVPGPEGGYPISLNYHAGIGVDQVSSWVGLGWNLNPGAINRGVAGYPDDWNQGKLIERFYDAGDSESQLTISTSYSGYGFSIANSFSFNSNKGFGGSMSFGMGMGSGDSGAGIGGTVGMRPGGGMYGSINAGYRTSSGFSVGGSIGTNGVGINADYENEEAGGSLGYRRSFRGEDSFSLSYRTGEDNAQVSVGIGFSSHSGFSVNGMGVSQNLGFNNSVSGGDYLVTEDNDRFSIAIPSPWGVFGFGYSKQEVRWSLNKKVESYVSSIFNLIKARKYSCRAKYEYMFYMQGAYYFPVKGETVKIVDDPSDCDCSIFIPGVDIPDSSYPTNGECLETEIIQDPYSSSKYFMDTYEIGEENKLKTASKNNAVFPAYDNYSVNSQGLSGNMKPYLFENGAITGMGQRDFVDEKGIYNLIYRFPEDNDWQAEYTDFSREINFSFTNSFANSIQIGEKNFSTNLAYNQENIFEYLQNPNSPEFIAPRKRAGNYVEYYTNQELLDGNTGQLILPSIPIQVPTDGNEAIGAYSITTPDGKTYHYALAVYNFETLTRTIDVLDKPERESYFESQQLKPYATHWLLTAITGPDYIDINANQNVDPEDYGYWVEFEYGKWSDAFAWKSPYGKPYDEDEITDAKTQTRGRKQLYYLDRIKTRTHTAIFVKNLKNDNPSQEWAYHAVENTTGSHPDPSTFDTPRFQIDEHKSLRLEEIIMVKNDKDDVNKSSGNFLVTPKNVVINYPGEKTESAFYQLEDKLIDVKDNLENVRQHALKIIDLGQHYNYTLSKEQNAYSGKLTLNGVTFKGKGGVQVLPSYQFDYEDALYDIENQDDWGYDKNKPYAWSLNKTTFPLGGEINIKYESDDYSKLAILNGEVFKSKLMFTFITEPPKGYGSSTEDIISAPEGITRIKIEVDDQDPEASGLQLADYFDPSKPFYMDMWYSAVYNHSGSGYDRSAVNIDSKFAEIIELNILDNYMIVDVMASSPDFRDVFQHHAEPVSVLHASGSYAGVENQHKKRYELAWTPNQNWRKYSMEHIIYGNKANYKQTGHRVKAISVTNSTGESTTTVYDYNKPGTSISSGVISYYPYKENSVQIPYASELPAPIPMYEYVTTKEIAGAYEDYQPNQFLQKNSYRFHVLPQKDPNSIQFGDYFKVNSFTNFNATNFNKDKEVNAKSYMVIDNLSLLGQVKEITTYNGQNQLLQKKTNEYFSRSEMPQAKVTKESFQTYKEVNRNNGLTDEWLINSSSRLTYPSALKSTTSIAGGTKNTTYFDEFDPNTGQVLASHTNLSNGYAVKTESLPAYERYSSMGSKIDDPTYKNMLTQSTMQKTYIDTGNGYQLASSSITTWNDLWSYRDARGTLGEDTNNRVWRKHKTYVWDGQTDEDGFYMNFQGDDDNFDWQALTQPSGSNWKQLSEVALYDHYSHSLESKDINGHHASNKYNLANETVSVSGNAKFTELFYSGAEYAEALYGNTYLAYGVEGNQHTSTVSHSGKYSAKASNGEESFKVYLKSGEHRSGTYKISVWIHKDNYTQARVKVNNSLASFNGEIIPAGDWVQMNHYVSLGSGNQQVCLTSSSQEVLFDDFRLHPVEASVKSFVYNQYGEVSCILNGNNLGTKYEYDAGGRLFKTFAEVVDDIDNNVEGGFKLSTKHTYHYKRSL